MAFWLEGSWLTHIQKNALADVVSNNPRSMSICYPLFESRSFSIHDDPYSTPPYLETSVGIADNQLEAPSQNGD